MNIDQLYAKYHNHTMVNARTFAANLTIAEVARAFASTSAIVECGTWKGGMIAAIAEHLGPDRPYYLFDSFEGLPDAQPIDGERALQWQADKRSPHYYNNCKADASDAWHAMTLAGARDFHIVKGWFKDTLEISNTGPIALLRVDADWYSSTMEVLDALYDRVVPGGAIILDDYYVWPGCSRAVHAFLTARLSPEKIRCTNEVAYIIKETQCES